MLGGFSACDPLLKQIQAQFDIEIQVVGSQASVAIVKGATFTNVVIRRPDLVVEHPTGAVNVQKFITNGIGMKVRGNISTLLAENQQLAKSDYYK